MSYSSIVCNRGGRYFLSRAVMPPTYRFRRSDVATPRMSNAIICRRNIRGKSTRWQGSSDHRRKQRQQPPSIFRARSAARLELSLRVLNALPVREVGPLLTERCIRRRSQSKPRSRIATRLMPETLPCLRDRPVGPTDPPESGLR